MGPDSPWGMVLHYPNEHLIDLLYQGGVSWLRTQVRFDSQPAPGQTPRWDDAVIQARAAYQGPPPTQEVYLNLDPNYPSWIANVRNTQNKLWLDRFQHWASFVRSAVSTFGGDRDMRVRYFHIGNEPNDSTFFRFGEEEYVNLLITAIQTIRSMGPPGKYKVCAPDIATGKEHDPWGFLGRCLSRIKIAGGLDVVSIHGYVAKSGSVNDLITSLLPVKGVLAAQGVTAPVWLTETGVNNFSSDAATQNGARVRSLCSFIGDGMMPFPREPKFLKKVFFFVWSEDEGEAGRTNQGEYAWLSRTSLTPNAQLWDAYRSVTGGQFPPKQRALDVALSFGAGSSFRLRPNQTRQLTIRATNTGTQRWTPELNFGLGSVDAGGAKPDYKITHAVEPGGQGFYDFTVNVTAPPVTGRYEYRWQMYEGGLQFGARLHGIITVE